jgi:ribonuclease P protein component
METAFPTRVGGFFIVRQQKQAEIIQPIFITFVSHLLRNMEQRFTFTKEERLCSKILIDKLFAGGKSVYSPPFRFVFLSVQYLKGLFPAQVVFSVPKKNFKLAVQRNLIRRRMREAYRLNKSGFYEGLELTGHKLVIMIIYIEKEISEYPVIETGIIKGLKKLLSKLNGNTPHIENQPDH